MNMIMLQSADKSELFLENIEIEGIKMRVVPDINNCDLVSFIFYKYGKIINWVGENEDDLDGQFSLNKFQVGCLIHYLKSIYKIMEHSKFKETYND